MTSAMLAALLSYTTYKLAAKARGLYASETHALEAQAVCPHPHAPAGKAASRPARASWWGRRSAQANDLAQPLLPDDAPDSAAACLRVEEGLATERPDQEATNQVDAGAAPAFQFASTPSGPLPMTTALSGRTESNLSAYSDNLIAAMSLADVSSSPMLDSLYAWPHRNRSSGSGGAAAAFHHQSASGMQSGMGMHPSASAPAFPRGAGTPSPPRRPSASGAAAAAAAEREREASVESAPACLLAPAGPETPRLASSAGVVSGDDDDDDNSKGSPLSPSLHTAAASQLQGEPSFATTATTADDVVSGLTSPHLSFMCYVTPLPHGQLVGAAPDNKPLQRSLQPSSSDADLDDLDAGAAARSGDGAVHAPPSPEADPRGSRARAPVLPAGPVLALLALSALVVCVDQAKAVLACGSAEYWAVTCAPLPVVALMLMLVRR